MSDSHDDLEPAAGDNRPARRSWTPLYLLLALAVGIPAVVAAASTLRHSAPPPQPTAPAVFAAHAPPTDRPLIWFQPQREQGATSIRLRALTWDGVEVGATEIPCRQPCDWQASPDGSRLLVSETPALGERLPNRVYDTAGRPVGIAPEGGSGMWADDSHHLCGLTPPAAPAVPGTPTRWTLWVTDSVSATPRSAAALDDMRASYWALLTCSPTADRAVLTLEDRDGVRGERVIRLSDGLVTYTREDATPGIPCGCPVQSLVTNHDGSHAIENLRGGGMQTRDLTTGMTTPLPAIASVNGRVQTISWAGRRALTAGGVIDPFTGRTFWEAPSLAGGAQISVRPNSDDLLVDVFQKLGLSSVDYIIHSDGTAVRLPDRYQ